ncbi:MAG: ferritin family protein [Planctomycetota bacterium]|jgi:rubrerythrin
MKKLRSINEVLDFAIAGENNAHELYTKMAAIVENPWMCKTLEGFAQEELQHRAKLEAVKAGKTALEREEVGDLGIADALEDIKPHAGMDYRELLAFAIKKENVSHSLYVTMASIFSEPELKTLFHRLAEEEADHKRRFEIEYDLTTS